MSTKFDLSIWISALEAYDSQDFRLALDLFQPLASLSKVRTNMGLIHATIGEHQAAIEQFKLATDLDEYLAVAYFQIGVSQFLLGNYDLALQAFDDTHSHLRGNQSIDYHQIGLSFVLYSTEILFNKGLCKLNLGHVSAGFLDLESAQKEKVTSAHGVIDEAIRDAGEGYTVFSIPVGVIYRPPDKKIKNCKIKDYLGKVKLISNGTREASSPLDQPSNLVISTNAPEILSRNTPSPAEKDKDDLDPPPWLLKRSATEPLPRRNASVTSTSDTDPDVAAPPVRGAVSGLRNAELSRSYSSPIRRSASTRTAPTAATDARGFNHTRYASLKRINTSPVPPGELMRTLSDSRSRPFKTASPPPSSYSPPVPRDMKRRGTLLTRSPLQQTYTSAGEGARRIVRRPTGRSMRTPELDEDTSSSASSSDAGFPSTRIMVKLHYQGDVRGMAVNCATPFDEFMNSVSSKFQKDVNGLALKFEDEDGVLVTLRDESDYDLAIETAKEISRGRINGRLAVWCADA